MGIFLWKWYTIYAIKNIPRNGGTLWGKCISNNNWTYIYTYQYCPNRWFRPGYNNQIDWSNPRPMFRAMDMVHKRFCLMRWGCRMRRQHNGNFGLAHKNCPRIRRLLRIRHTNWRRNRMTPNRLWSVCSFLGCIRQYQDLYPGYIFRRDIASPLCTLHQRWFHQNKHNMILLLYQLRCSVWGRQCSAHWRCWA